MTANYGYSRTNADNLPLPVKMQLSPKRKTFSSIFMAVLDSALHFEDFQTKKSRLIAHIILDLLTPKDVLTSTDKRSFF